MTPTTISAAMQDGTQYSVKPAYLLGSEYDAFSGPRTATRVSNRQNPHEKDCDYEISGFPSH